jgi:hypothetical protein
MFVKSNTHLQDNADNYGIGGYHPSYVGEVLNERYVILKKIAMTQYSSIWAAKDWAFDIYVTIKIFKSAPNYNEIALEEVEKLQYLHKKSRDDKWMSTIQRYKGMLDLNSKISDTENFCVK